MMCYLHFINKMTFISVKYRKHMRKKTLFFNKFVFWKTYPMGPIFLIFHWTGKKGSQVLGMAFRNQSFQNSFYDSFFFFFLEES